MVDLNIYAFIQIVLLFFPEWNDMSEVLGLINLYPEIHSTG